MYPVNLKSSNERTQNNGYYHIQIIKELIDVKEGNSYVPFFTSTILRPFPIFTYMKNAAFEFS